MRCGIPGSADNREKLILEKFVQEKIFFRITTILKNYYEYKVLR